MSDELCGAGITIIKTDPPMQGITICTQEPDHDGPHVGHLSWPVLDRDAS